MKQVYLIRHAQSENNAILARIVAELGDDLIAIEARAERERVHEPDLSEVGHQQARLLGEALSPKLRDRQTLLVASPMLRSLLTAREIADRLHLARDRFLCYGKLYEVGGAYFGEDARPSTTRAEIERDHPVRCVEVGEEGWYAYRNGRETMEQANARVDRVIAWLKQTLSREDVDVLVAVAHGDLLTRLLRRWLGVGWQQGMAFVHGNTGITELIFAGSRGILLKGLNDLAHLPDHLRTGDGDGWMYYTRPGLRIDRFEGSDALPEELAEVLLEIREREFWSMEGSSEADHAESDAWSIHFVAHLAGELAGYVQFDPEQVRLRQMLVMERYRGKGLGYALVDTVIKEARARGCSEVRVHAWLSSVPFYQRAGFVEQGDPRSDSSVPWHLMAHPLP